MMVQAIIDNLCSSSKNPYPPHGRSLEIPRRRGVLRAKFLEAMYEYKPEFPGERGGGCKTKNLPSRGEYGYFLKLHILLYCILRHYCFFVMQANALVNSLIGENRISTLGLVVVDEVQMYIENMQ